jgi:hypothetical protein
VEPFDTARESVGRETSNPQTRVTDSAEGPFDHTGKWYVRPQLPSSQAALRPPGPLRTGRESFPSPSSSPSNASLEEKRFRNGKALTMYPVMALWMK